MKWFTAIALACMAFVTNAQAQPVHPPGLAAGKKRNGAPVSSPNRIASSQLASGHRPVHLQPPGRGDSSPMLIDAQGREIGRPFPGFWTSRPLVSTRLNGMTLMIDGLSSDTQCDGSRCRSGPGLAWEAANNMLLMYASADCSGRPEASFHPSVAGFDAIAFTVREGEGLFMYVARNTPRDTWVRSYRNPFEPVCNSEGQGYAETTLPLEAVYPAEHFGVAPMRWR